MRYRLFKGRESLEALPGFAGRRACKSEGAKRSTDALSDSLLSALIKILATRCRVFGLPAFRVSSSISANEWTTITLSASSQLLLLHVNYVVQQDGAEDEVAHD